MSMVKRETTPGKNDWIATLWGLSYLALGNMTILITLYSLMVCVCFRSKYSPSSSSVVFLSFKSDWRWYAFLEGMCLTPLCSVVKYHHPEKWLHHQTYFLSVLWGKCHISVYTCELTEWLQSSLLRYLTCSYRSQMSGDIRLFSSVIMFHEKQQQTESSSIISFVNADSWFIVENRLHPFSMIASFLEHCDLVFFC